MRTLMFAVAPAVIAGHLASCASYQAGGTPTGHFCYRQPSNDQTYKYFACAFELSEASPYYDQPNIDGVVDRFIESKANRCQIYHRETLVDPQYAQIDHAYRLVVVHIKCGKGLNSAGS